MSLYLHEMYVSYAPSRSSSDYFILGITLISLSLSLSLSPPLSLSLEDLDLSHTEL